MSELLRSISLPLITFYGLGTILGAGIYVLIGEVAGLAGMSAPIAFLVASLLVAATAFSYAELTARHPVSAGEAAYTQAAFNYRPLSITVGLLVALVALVSSATIANGFVGYLNIFIEIPGWLAITLLLIILGGIAIWGITESIWLATLATLVELGGLLLIIVVTGENIVTLPARLPEIIPSADMVTWGGIFAGAYLAFYAFIGFEDMVNVAEEVKQPKRNLPIAIILVLIISTLLYITIALLAVLSLPPEELAMSDAPLALLYEQATGDSPTLITMISLFAVVNGALIQLIMASRILYGMSRLQWIPKIFGQVNRVTRTPLFATLVVVSIALALALWLPLITLAKLTSFITLVVFSLMNLILIVVKKRHPNPVNVKTYPPWLPWCGFIFSSIFVIYQLFSFF